MAPRSRREDFDHTLCLITVIDKAFTILLRTNDVLLVPLICWKAEDLAFSPCSGILEKPSALERISLRAIEHMDDVLELNKL